MWVSPRSLLMGIGPRILSIIVVVALIVVTAYKIHGCYSDTTKPDFLEDARDGILDSAAEQRAENDRRIEELEAQLYDLRVQVENLDAEVAESAKYREGIHDAIDLAITIDDIDRVLRGGIPGVSGR